MIDFLFGQRILETDARMRADSYPFIRYAEGNPLTTYVAEVLVTEIVAGFRTT